MEQYLIDTNVVSDYLSASLPAAGIDFLDTVIDAVPNLSVISQIEILCWNTDKATTENALLPYRHLAFLFPWFRIVIIYPTVY